MRAEGDVTQISWREPSVRGFARDKVGLAFTAVLSLHLLGVKRTTARSAFRDGQEREVTKHVESFGVFSWIRVQFSAPPPSLNFGLRNSNFGFTTLSLERDLKSAIRNPQSEISTLPIGIFDSGVGGLTVY